MREHRLYQADWLLRKYGFSYEELLVRFRPETLNLQKDLEASVAESHLTLSLYRFRRAIQRSNCYRVPGIGPSYAQRIVQERGSCALSSLEDLRLPPATLRKQEPSWRCE